MRLIITTLLCSLVIGCSSKQPSSDEKMAVIAAVYERIPKAIPPPAPPLPASEQMDDEDSNDINYSELKLVIFKSKFKKIKKIDTSKLDTLIDEDLVFWDRQTITKDEQTENGITGIISFSNVSFNANFTKAAVVVAIILSTLVMVY